MSLLCARLQLHFDLAPGIRDSSPDSPLQLNENASLGCSASAPRERDVRLSSHWRPAAQLSQQKPSRTTGTTAYPEAQRQAAAGSSKQRKLPSSLWTRHCVTQAGSDTVNL